MYDALHPVLFDLRTKEVERRHALLSHDHRQPAMNGWRAEKRRAETKPVR